MSIADGTLTAAEAFKKMAYEIIKELYRVLVVQKIVGSWTAGEGGAPGSGSGLVGLIMKGIGGLPSAEGGGFTGVGSRSGGVDGRGGFHAILHPNETVIDHTQRGAAGGGGGSQTVVQNVTVNALGDGDIERVLAKHMGKLKEMVISTMKNERMRGAF